MHFTNVIKGLRLYKVKTWGADSNNMADGTDREPTTDLREADVISSLVERTANTNYRQHKLVIDVDVPVTVIDSTTPGHHHLIIDKEINEYRYFNLITALADAGIIEQGYAVVSKELRGETQVRLPWVRKP